MPCDSGGYGPSYGDINELKKENDRMARILCGILRTLDTAGIQIALTEDAKKWKEKHEAYDNANNRPWKRSN